MATYQATVLASQLFHFSSSADVASLTVKHVVAGSGALLRDLTAQVQSLDARTFYLDTLPIAYTPSRRGQLLRFTVGLSAGGSAETFDFDLLSNVPYIFPDVLVTPDKTVITCGDIIATGDEYLTNPLRLRFAPVGAANFFYTTTTPGEQGRLAYSDGYVYASCRNPSPTPGTPGVQLHRWNRSEANLTLMTTIWETPVYWHDFILIPGGGASIAAKKDGSNVTVYFKRTGNLGEWPSDADAAPVRTFGINTQPAVLYKLLYQRGIFEVWQHVGRISKSSQGGAAGSWTNN